MEWLIFFSLWKLVLYFGISWELESVTKTSCKVGNQNPAILTVLSLSGTCEISLLSSEGQRISPLTNKSSLAACSVPLNLLKQYQQNKSAMLLHIKQSLKQLEDLQFWPACSSQVKIKSCPDHVCFYMHILPGQL